MEENKNEINIDQTTTENSKDFKHPGKFIVATYKYSLKISNTKKKISGFLEAESLLDAENKLKSKYSFDPSSLKLTKEKEFTLHDVFNENIFHPNVYSNESLQALQNNQNFESLKLAENINSQTSLSAAIQNESQGESLSQIDKYISQPLKDFFKKFKNTSKTNSSENIPLQNQLTIQIDYRKIIEYEERLKKLEEESKKDKVQKISNVVEKRLDQLQNKLFDLQLKIEQKTFDKDDNTKINQLKDVIDEFERRVHGIMEKIKSSGDLVPTRIQRVSRKAINMLDELDESKKGNTPVHVREKVNQMKLEEEKKYATKLAEQTRKIEEKVQFLHQLIPDLDNEKDIKRIEKKIEILEKRFNENRMHPILVKYFPDLADEELVKHFKGMEHTIDLETAEKMKEQIYQAVADKDPSKAPLKKFLNLGGVNKVKKEGPPGIFDLIKKYGLKEAFEQIRADFIKKGGMKGLFERTRNNMLGRKKFDILDNPDERNKMDDIVLTDSQSKMKSKFNFHISEEEKKKKEEADRQILEGAKQTGNPLQDFFNSLNDFLIDMGGVKVKEKSIFYRLLSVMVSAGIPLIKSLHELVRQQENPKFKKVLHQLTKSIEGGASLSRSMQQFPDVFEESIIGMIKSGEVSGTLPGILQRIADNIEKSAALAGKVKGAMMYPLVLVFVLVGAVTAILVLVLPKLMPMFMGAGVELPMSTKLLIFLSEVLQHQGHFVILGIIIIVISFKQFHKTYEGKYYVDLIVLKIPIFGMLLKNMLLAKFSRTLSSLTASGLSIIKSLKINADSIGNEVYKIEILEIADKVKLGNTIGEIIDGNVLFPSMLVNMIKVGEESAALGDVSGRLAKFYEEETDEMVKNLTTLMEPIIITSLAVVVGFIMMAVMQPILALTENVK